MRRMFLIVLLLLTASNIALAVGDKPRIHKVRKKPARPRNRKVVVPMKPRQIAADRKQAVAMLTKNGVDEIIFSARKVDGDGHWYANFSYNSRDPKRLYYHDGGQLSRLNVKTGKVTHLIDDPKGGVRGVIPHRQNYVKKERRT